MWQMQFNIDKCFILRVGRPKHKLVHFVHSPHQTFSETDSAKYLGLTITSDLQWNQHINNITNKANSIIGLLRRNLRIPSHTIKTHAYQSLVRPHLEYASTVWDPPNKHNLVGPMPVSYRRGGIISASYYCNGPAAGRCSSNLGIRVTRGSPPAASRVFPGYSLNT